mgnify:CR=1 FL=1
MVNKETFEVEYSKRGFRQDSDDAMRGDIVRGLVEIITNADDAYIRNKDNKGAIHIATNHLDIKKRNGRATIFVADSAGGMSYEEMRQKLSIIGARTSNYEQGERVRGLLGRGFKDVASFGSIELESIKANEWSKITLDNDGKVVLLTGTEEKMDTIRERLRLKLGESGSTVTINCDNSRNKTLNNKVSARLSTHFELRGIINSRDVFFEEIDTKKTRVQKLFYEAPSGKRILEKTVSIPNYPDAEAKFEVYEMDEGQSGQINAESHHGIIIHGEHAMYENTMFSLSSRPGAAFVRGYFSCSYIDDLIREFDDKQEQDLSPTEANPMRLVSRARDGLISEHPFVGELRTLFARELIPLLDEIEEKHRGERTLGGNTERKFEAISRELSKLLAQDLLELDEDLPPGDGPDPAALSIIPAGISLRPNERKTLTVHIDHFKIDKDWNKRLEISSDAPSVVSIEGNYDIPNPHQQNPNILVSRFQIQAGPSEGNAVITVKSGSEIGKCVVNVSITEVPQDEPPNELEFKYPKLSLRAGRSRKIEIRAPLDLVIGSSPEVLVQIDGDQSFELMSNVCNLRLVKGGWYSGLVTLISDKVNAKGQLIAKLESHSATCEVETVPLSDSKGLDFQINWEDSSIGDRRASLTESHMGYELKIFGKHEAMSHLLGGYDEISSEFEKADSREVSLVLAEILASEITHFLLEREFNHQSATMDAAAYASKYQKRLSKYLVITQRMLISG